jgi:tetrahydromethanopterin S-methyltransferase subunit G
MSDTDLRVLEQKFKDHCESDIEAFERINDSFFKVNEKLDKLVLGMNRLETIEEISKETGEKAGRRTAQIWGAVVAFLVVALDRIMEKLF